MLYRLFEILLAAILLLLALPFLLIAIVGIFITSGRPVFFLTTRAGLNGRGFRIIKLRTMHAVRGSPARRITSGTDGRIFRWGALLRRTKLDEVPQLLNIILGQMAFVGPRPEDPNIVQESYTAEYLHTLSVKPGLTSPGTLWYYTAAEDSLPQEHTEDFYLEKILPTKMALDLYYLKIRTPAYDIMLILRTALTLLQRALGKTNFRALPEYSAALKENAVVSGANA